LNNWLIVIFTELPAVIGAAGIPVIIPAVQLILPKQKEKS
jgi:hypothetical protein